MKKRVLLVLLLLVAVVAYGAMPKMVQSNIPAVYYITPNQTTYENVVGCSGTVQSGDVRQVYLQSTVVADEVLVQVGDLVEAGDTLVRLHPEKTAYLGSLPLSIAQEAAEEVATDIDWTALAAGYGLSTAVSGSATSLDTSALEGLLQDSGLLTDVDAGALAGIGDKDIAAPISGVVTAVDIQTNAPAVAGKAILTIADITKYKVIVSVREEDISRVHVGDAAKVRGVGFSGTVYRGTVTKISPTARKMYSGTASAETVVDAEIELERPDNRLKPGFSAKVEILGERDYEMITVPYEAIKQDENNDEYVYLYENGKLKKQVVVTGQELSSQVEILNGITADNVVVYNPPDEIKEGAMIQIKGRANVT